MTGVGVDFITCKLFFPGPLHLFKKAVEKINSYRNILNSSVNLNQSHIYLYLYIYVRNHRTELNNVINMMLLIIHLSAYLRKCSEERMGNAICAGEIYFIM